MAAGRQLPGGPDGIGLEVGQPVHRDLGGVHAFTRMASLWRQDEQVTIRGDAPLLDRLLCFVGCADRFRRG